MKPMEPGVHSLSDLQADAPAAPCREPTSEPRTVELRALARGRITSRSSSYLDTHD
jgi:hypothetical protein